MQWAAFIPPESCTLEIWVKWMDGENTYGPYQAVRGQPIPWVTKEANVTNATLEVEVRATTRVSSLSPELSSLNMEMEVGISGGGMDLSRQRHQCYRGSRELFGFLGRDHVDPSKSALEVFVGISKQELGFQFQINP